VAGRRTAIDIRRLTRCLAPAIGDPTALLAGGAAPAWWSDVLLRWGQLADPAAAARADRETALCGGGEFVY
jgi:hypothetical protein